MSFLYQRKALPTFKLIVLGDSGVGKTTLVSRMNGREPPLFEPTIGCAFSRLQVKNKNESPEFELNIWDTAGQERYNSILDLYYSNVDVCLLVYDVNDDISLARIFEIWLPHYLNSRRNNTADYSYKLFYLVGNKDDQVIVEPIHNATVRRTLNQYQAIIKQYQIKLWTISALKNHYMDQLIQDIYDSIRRQLLKHKTDETSEKSEIVQLVDQVNSDADAKYMASWREWVHGFCVIL